MHSFESETRLRAFGGGPLVGNRWLKQIYLDEAGTSQVEPVAVVAAVVIDPDFHFREVERRIDAAIKEYIPAEIRPGFVFHAKDIYGKFRNRFAWSYADCLEILSAWLRVRSESKLPTVLSYAKKQIDLESGKITAEDNKVAHMLAFGLCYKNCDELMERFYNDEVASVIAEDCSDMRRALNAVAKAYNDDDVPDIIRKSTGSPISHIKNAVQYCQKDEALFLQIADACAFAFRRYMLDPAGKGHILHKLQGIDGEKLNVQIRRPFDVGAASSLVLFNSVPNQVVQGLTGVGAA